MTSTITETLTPLARASDSQVWWRDVVMLSVGLVLLFGFTLGSRALWEPDEGRYAEIPREMLASGDFVTPRLNGVKYFEKPALFYWLEAGAIRVLGLNEWALRLWPALFALFGGLAVYAGARSLYDRRTGLLAAAILATSPLYFLLARILTLDMAVSVLLSVALLAFLVGAREPPGARRRWLLWGFYLATALAVLMKGLMSIVLPAMIIGAWVALRGEWRLLKTIHLPSGIALFLVVSVPWHVLAARANPDFLSFYFIHEHVERYLTTVHHRYQPVWFFVPVLIAGFFPWTGLLPQALADVASGGWRRLRDDSAGLFLVLWAVIVVLFFSLSDSKLVPYVLPVVPSLAILVARYLMRADHALKAAGIRAGSWTVLITGVLLAAVLLAVPAYLARHPAIEKFSPLLDVEVYLWAATLLMLAVVPFVFVRRQRPLAALISLVGLSAFSLSVVAANLPQLDDWRSIKSLATVLKPRLKADDQVVSYLSYFQGLPVYLDRTVTIAGWKGELEHGTETEDVSAWIIDVASFRERWQSASRVYAFARQSNLASLDRHALSYYRLAEAGPNALITNHPPTP